jgi:hypothetical protein
MRPMAISLLSWNRITVERLLGEASQKSGTANGPDQV